MCTYTYTYIHIVTDSTDVLYDILFISFVSKCTYIKCVHILFTLDILLD